MQTATDTPTDTPTGTPRPPIPFAELMRARLLVWIWIRGSSPTALSKAMGRTHSYLGRKLNPEDGEPRELTTAEIDEVLAKLGLPPTALFEPAFGPGDRELLGWIASRADGEPRTWKAARRTGLFPGAEKAAKRLAEQRLVELAEDGTLTITAEGRPYAVPALQ